MGRAEHKAVGGPRETELDKPVASSAPAPDDKAAPPPKPSDDTEEES